MKSLYLFYSLSIFSASVLSDVEFKLTGLFFGCERDVTKEYHRALQDFSTRLFKEVAKGNNDNFVMSQYSIWLALSAIAEAADKEIKDVILKALNLPQDGCLREKYYEIATSLESSGLGSNGSDVTITRKRVMVFNDDVKVNASWASSVRASGLIDTEAVDFENNSQDFLKNLTKPELSDIDLKGNALILDSLDYEGLWTTAFDNVTENADFFDDDGKKIGQIEMLKVKKHVKLAHLPLLNAKLLELPVGTNGRYRMLFIVNLGKNPIRRTIERFPSSLIVDMMPFLFESLIPLEVAIPRFEMSSHLDLRTALADMGLEGIWKDANFTKYISSPPPKLSTITQRATASISKEGLLPSHSLLPIPTAGLTGLAGAAGRSFIANRPFIYGLVDAVTRTWLFAGAYSKPN